MTELFKMKEFRPLFIHLFALIKREWKMFGERNLIKNTSQSPCVTSFRFWFKFPVNLSIYHSIYLSIYLSFYVYIYLSIYLSNLFILACILYIYTLLFSFFCLNLNPMNVKTAEPIGPKFLWDITWHQRRFMNEQNFKN